MTRTLWAGTLAAIAVAAHVPSTHALTAQPLGRQLRAAISRCKKRHRAGAKRKKCIAQARRRAERARSMSAGGDS